MTSHLDKQGLDYRGRGLVTATKMTSCNRFPTYRALQLVRPVVNPINFCINMQIFYRSAF